MPRLPSQRPRDRLRAVDLGGTGEVHLGATCPRQPLPSTRVGVPPTTLRRADSSAQGLREGVRTSPAAGSKMLGGNTPNALLSPCLNTSSAPHPDRGALKTVDAEELFELSVSTASPEGLPHRWATDSPSRSTDSVPVRLSVDNMSSARPVSSTTSTRRVLMTSLTSLAAATAGPTLPRASLAISGTRATSATSARPSFDILHYSNVAFDNTLLLTARRIVGSKPKGNTFYVGLHDEAAAEVCPSGDRLEIQVHLSLG